MPTDNLPSWEEIAEVIEARMQTIPYFNGDVYDFSESAKAVLLLIKRARRRKKVK